MFFEAHRLSIFTPRALDVDVVLDLMIHDLDIVLTFAASPVREVRAVGLPILSPKVDIANVRVEFESGCVANFTASRVSTERVRKLRFFEPRQYVSIDYARQDLLVIRIDGEPGSAQPAGIASLLQKALAAGLDPGKLAALAAALPPQVVAAITAGKIDANITAKIAATGLVDPAILAKLGLASSGPAPGLSFVKPEVTPGEPCASKSNPSSTPSAPAAAQSHRPSGPQRPRSRPRNSGLDGRPRPPRRPRRLLLPQRIKATPGFRILAAILRHFCLQITHHQFKPPNSTQQQMRDPKVPHAHPEAGN